MHSSVPKRIILSRKGWDNKAGGKPSAILPDGTHVSFPIPDRESGTTYNDVRMKDGRSIGQIVEKLTRGRITGESEVHLDPDLEPHTVERPHGFLAAFGQCGAAQTHLWNEGVRKATSEQDGDLFLFFGLYRPILRDGSGWSYTRIRELHMLFGWLQVGTILTLSSDQPPKQLMRHPHVRRSFIVQNELGSRHEDNNTLYVARDRLSFAPEIAGAGVFGAVDVNNFDDPRRLTYGDRSCSQWRLPSFFHTISNMGDQQVPNNGWWYPQRRGPGQEFVLQTVAHEEAVHKWLGQVFKHAIRRSAAGNS